MAIVGGTDERQTGAERRFMEGGDAPPYAIVAKTERIGEGSRRGSRQIRDDPGRSTQFDIDLRVRQPAPIDMGVAMRKDVATVARESRDRCRVESRLMRTPVVVGKDGGATDQTGREEKHRTPPARRQASWAAVNDA